MPFFAALRKAPPAPPAGATADRGNPRWAPAGTPAGPGTLVVVANGLASAPVSVTVSG